MNPSLEDLLAPLPNPFSILLCNSTRPQVHLSRVIFLGVIFLGGSLLGRDCLVVLLLFLFSSNIYELFKCDGFVHDRVIFILNLYSHFSFSLFIICPILSFCIPLC